MAHSPPKRVFFYIIFMLDYFFNPKTLSNNLKPTTNEKIYATRGNLGTF
jgi:hypothetical protein